ncbi:hypothetical protein IPG36_08220 [bacterium]|nr:MAG: hypothetical protein IPG36_08220 [bacterium]
MGDDLPDYDTDDTAETDLKYHRNHYLTTQQVRRFRIWLDIVPMLVLVGIAIALVVLNVSVGWVFAAVIVLFVAVILQRSQALKVRTRAAEARRTAMRQAYENEQTAQRQHFSALLGQAEKPQDPSFNEARLRIHQLWHSRGRDSTTFSKIVYELEAVTRVRTIVDAITAEEQAQWLGPQLHEKFSRLDLARKQSYNELLPRVDRIAAMQTWRHMCVEIYELISGSDDRNRSILPAAVNAADPDNRTQNLAVSCRESWEQELDLRWTLLQTGNAHNDNQESLRSHRNWIWKYVQDGGSTWGQPHDRRLPETWNQVVVAAIEPRTIDLDDWYGYLNFDHDVQVAVADWFVRSVAQAITTRTPSVMSPEVLIAAYYLHNRADVRDCTDNADREVVLSCHLRLALPFRPQLRALSAD